MNRRLRDGLFAAAGLLVLSAAALFGAREEAPPPSVPSIADDGPRGAAAFALLLSREGFKTSAYRRRMTELRDSSAALVLLGTPDDAAEPPTRGETDALAVWVRRGGHLLVAGNPVDDAALRTIAGFSMLNLKVAERRARAGAGLSRAAFAPREIAGHFERGIRTRRGDEVLARTRAGAVAVRRRAGKGDVTFVADASVFSNASLARADNARFAVAIVPEPRVAFDETLFGFGETKGFWDVLTPPLRAAVLLWSVVLLLGIAGNLFPFAPPAAALAERGRTSAAYVDSLARLLHAGRARRHAIATFADAASSRMRKRPAGTHLRELRSRLSDLAARLRPSDADVLEAARLHALIRKELP